MKSMKPNLQAVREHTLFSTLNPKFKYHQVHGSAAKLVIKLAGVAPEVNLKKPLHAGDKDTAEFSTLNLKNREGVITIPKQRYHYYHAKGLSFNMKK